MFGSHLEIQSLVATTSVNFELVTYFFKEMSANIQFWKKTKLTVFSKINEVIQASVLLKTLFAQITYNTLQLKVCFQSEKRSKTWLNKQYQEYNAIYCQFEC